jgi:hypothetical protein
MIVETATIYAFCGLVVSMTAFTVYMSIVFMLFYIAGWALSFPFRAIVKILSV